MNKKGAIQIVALVLALVIFAYLLIAFAGILGIFMVLAAYIFKTGKVPFYNKIRRKIKKIREFKED